jgi:hypothetical protein
VTRRALLALLFVSACASPPPEAQPPSLRPAFERLVIGKSTKADVRAALGDALVIDFDSGYEVWVYRESRAGAKPPAHPTELVLLFAPSGMLAKSRVRDP